MTAHLRPSPGAPRTRAALPRAMLPLDSLAVRDDLRMRSSSECDPRHVQDLTATVRHKGKLDDLLVWAEEMPDGTPTGRYVILDGLHRRAAYRSAWRSPKDRHRGVPVSIFTGPLMEARLTALAANSRRKLGLSKAERMNAAWRMVWDYGYDLSKSRLAGAADVSESSIRDMRARWQEMLAAGNEPSFDWRRDRGTDDAATGAPDLDPERQAAITAATVALRRLLLRRPRPSTEYVTDVLTDLIGANELAYVADYVRGVDLDEDFASEGTSAEPREGTPSGDF